MEEDPAKYVLGIEGSANKVGVGTFNHIQVSLISMVPFFPTLARLSSLLPEPVSCLDKLQNIIPKKSSPSSSKP